MRKTVDVYLPLDARKRPNQVVWPVAKKQLAQILRVIRKCGWTPNVLNPDQPVSSVAMGIRVARQARGARFLNFIAGWAYPDFSVSPMWQLPADVPKLMLGSTLPDFPGAVGLLAAAGGTEHVGIRTSRLFVEEFNRPAGYADALATFLKTGDWVPARPKPIAIPVSESQRQRARAVKNRLRGMLYGAIGPRSMQMWNKISEADFLRIFGIAREGFDGLRLLKMTEKIPAREALESLRFLERKGLEFRWGPDPKKHLTHPMALFQMKVYHALLQLKDEYGLDFIGVQDQLDWIDHYPATDLTLGILNNRLRPDGDGETIVAATEADDGAAITMQVLKLLSGGEPAGFNDLRYWKDGLYYLVNSGALAPYFARGSHTSLKGAWSERQTAMYFRHGGGTCSCVVRIPGTITWARFSYRAGKMYLCAGRGVTDVPTAAQWRARAAHCSPDWPHWHVRMCGRIENWINTNHPMTVCGDYLAELKALAGELNIPFECYDHKNP